MATITSRKPHGVKRSRSALPDAFAEKVSTWITTKRLVDRAKVVLEGDKRSGTVGLRPQLLEAAKAEGRPDEKGSRWLTFTEPIAGLSALKAQRRVTEQVFQRDAAENLIRDREVFDECSAPVITLRDGCEERLLEVLKSSKAYAELVEHVERRVDENRLLRYKAEHPDTFTDADLDALWVDEEGWSLIPVETPATAE